MLDQASSARTDHIVLYICPCIKKELDKECKNGFSTDIATCHQQDSWCFLAALYLCISSVDFPVSCYAYSFFQPIHSSISLDHIPHEKLILKGFSCDALCSEGRFFRWTFLFLVV